MRNLRLVTAPSLEPLTTAQAKTHLRVTDSDYDTEIDYLVQVAREKYERDTNRCLITTEYALYLDNWPDKSTDYHVLFPRAPLQDINSLQYYDTDGVLTELTDSAGDFDVIFGTDANSEPGRMYLQPGQSFPNIYTNMTSPIRIQFTAGFGDSTTDIPQIHRQAVRLLLGYYFDQMRDLATERSIQLTMKAYDDIVNQHKLWSFGD